MVPKHRRSEVEPSLASRGAPAEPAEFWPEAAGYDGAAARASLAAALEDQSWQESQDWRDWGPPPALHPDHPSAPVPRVQILPEDPSEYLAARPARGAADLVQRQPQAPARTWYEPPAAAPAYPEWREPTGFQFQPGPAGPPPAAGWLPGSESPDGNSLWMAGQVLTLADSRAAQIAQEARDYALAVCEAAEREAAAITHGAATWAQAITQQANSHAAGIRQAAEREAAALRARLESMPGELSQVVTAYVSESLAAPVLPAAAPLMAPGAPLIVPDAPLMPPTAPVLPGGRPSLPGPRPASPEPGLARPDAGLAPPTSPAGPHISPTQPDTRTTRPRARPGADPDARPARPRTTPGGKPQRRPRQRQAMRIATGATATLLLFSAIAGGAEIGLHGFKFFVFREAGVGQTSGNETDQQFLARQRPAAHHPAAPKGRHHKKPHQTLEVHHN